MSLGNDPGLADTDEERMMRNRRIPRRLLHFSAWLGMLAVLLAIAHPVRGEEILFSGRLAAADCRADQDAQIVDAEVHVGESATCVVPDGVRLRIVNTLVAEGSRFRVAAGKPATRWALTDCRSEDPFELGDCNRCAHDVVSQFMALFDEEEFDEEENSWTFDAGERYPPSLSQGRELSNSDLHSHVQGFVRTNSPARPLAGTYSGARALAQGALAIQPGFIFVVQEKNGLKLAQLHRSWSRHPSGAAILGERLWFGDERDGIDDYVIRSLLVDGDEAAEQAYLPLSSAFQGDRPSVGGGLGLAKLTSGGYMLITVGPGGDEDNPLTNFFYLARQPNPETGKLGRLGRVVVDGLYALDLVPLARWSLDDAIDHNEASSEEFKQSENVTVITECETGDLFVVNSTGDHGAIGAFGEAYYRLSRIEWRPLSEHNVPRGKRQGVMGPQLRPVAWGRHNQNINKCHPRSAATLWVNGAHRLELYCSELKANAVERRMRFTRRTLR